MYVQKVLTLWLLCIYNFCKVINAFYFILDGTFETVKFVRPFKQILFIQAKIGDKCPVLFLWHLAFSLER
jgi:hypothetical protein